MITHLGILARRSSNSRLVYGSGKISPSFYIYKSVKKFSHKGDKTETAYRSENTSKNSYKGRVINSKGRRKPTLKNPAERQSTDIYGQDTSHNLLVNNTKLFWRKIDRYIRYKCGIIDFTAFYPKDDAYNEEDMDRLYRIMILVLSHNTSAEKEVGLIMNALATHNGITYETLSKNLLYYDAIYGNSSDSAYEKFFKVIKRVIQTLKEEYDGAIPDNEQQFFDLYPPAKELIGDFENEEYSPPQNARFSLDYNGFKTFRTPITWRMLDALSRRKFDSINYQKKFSDIKNLTHSRTTYAEMRDIRYQQLLLLFLSSHCRTRQSAIDILIETLQKIKVQNLSCNKGDTGLELRISPFTILNYLDCLFSAMNEHAVPDSKRRMATIKVFTERMISLHDQDIPLTLEGIKYDISPDIARELEMERSTVFKYSLSKSFKDILITENRTRPNQNTVLNSLLYPTCYSVAETNTKIKPENKTLMKTIVDNVKIYKEFQQGLTSSCFEPKSDIFSMTSSDAFNRTELSLWYYIDNAYIIKTTQINHAELVNITSSLTGNQVRFHRLLFICLSTKLNAKIISEGLKCMAKFLKINSGDGLTIGAIVNAPETKFLSLNFPHGNIITRLARHLAIIIEDFYNGRIPQSLDCMEKLGLIINERKQLTSKNLGRTYYEQIFNPNLCNVPPYQRIQYRQSKKNSEFAEPPLKQPWITIERISDANNVPSTIPTSVKSELKLSSKKTFTVFTFNALADTFWKSSFKELANSTFHNELENRNEMYRNILGYYRPDIICLQEIPRNMYIRFWVRTLAEMGYMGVFQEKGMKDQELASDGIAIFYKPGRFELLKKTVIHLNDQNKLFEKYLQDKSKVEIYKRYRNKPHVALMVELCDLDTKAKLAVINTHLIAGSENRDVRFIQSHTLMIQIAKKMQAKKNIGIKTSESSPLKRNGLDCRHPIDDTSLIICGDLNTDENTIITELLSTGTVNHQTRGLTKIFGEATVTEPVQQPCTLTSAYSYIDHPPTMYHNNEVLATVDYIWYSSNRFKLKGLLGAPKDFYQQREIRLPSNDNPSDHVPLMCEFASS